MSCCNNPDHNPGYVFGSAIITVIIGALAFIVALAWNSLVQKAFETYESHSDELEARLSYVFVVTALAIILAFFTMYYIAGVKW